MKFLMISSILLSSMASLAASKAFTIQKKEVSINGLKDTQASTFEVKPGEPVEIGMALSDAGNPLIAELTVVDDQGKTKDGILMKVQITEEVDGEKKIVDTMNLMGHSGKEVQMAVGPKGKKAFAKVSLVGTRVQ